MKSCIPIIALLIFMVLFSACQSISPGLSETLTNKPTLLLIADLQDSPQSTRLPIAKLPPDELIRASVFFTDTRSYAVGRPPFEISVIRQAQPGTFLPGFVLQQFFLGPDDTERARGLDNVTSGFTGVRELVIKGNTAYVYLDGPCQSGGATYTVVQPIMANLLQFEQIDYVKIFDGYGNTWDPDGPGNSIPPCLEP